MKPAVIAHSLFLFFSVMAPQSSNGAFAAETTRHLNATDFIKIRCNTTGENATTVWQGNVTTTGVSSDKSQTLFKIVGFNIARCFLNDAGDWMVSSREMTFYLDPTSGELLTTWKNPWTGESVRVVHIANALVQQKIPATLQLPVVTAGDNAIARIDVPLSYPNPLAADERFKDFSPEAFYKAHESFSYVFRTKALETLSSETAVADVMVSWTRVSQWLPWMKMKGASGQLVFNAIVTKSDTHAELPELIKKIVSSTDTGIYLDAPRCIVANQPNVSSWTYFKKHFESYVQGAEFPRPEPSTLAAAECN